MKEIIIQRLFDNGKQTTGQGVLFEGHKTKMYFTTLELSWNNNERNVSCIPKGKYIAKVRTSQKYGKHLHLQNVEGRSMILVHFGNYNHNTKGCILAGEKFAKLNNDSSFDITNSRKTMGRIMDFVGDDVEVMITIDTPAKYV